MGPATDSKSLRNAALDRPTSADITRLVTEHHDFVYRVAYRLTGSTADAEDLAQQTFLAAHRNLAQLREADAARGWLASILRNLFWKQLRKRRPSTAGSLELDLDKIPASPPDDPAVDGELLQKALDQLPAESREVLVMFYFEELAYREIAEALELPIGTVMSRLARAKRRLHELLAPKLSAPKVELARTTTEPAPKTVVV
jgi:RNA polymerase sigma-70 factor (ECF subfamily)